ncbi:peptide/nickel transport system permease protein [Brevibacterium sanguinis]|uniref:Peptide/nickel transport system permease protein n=2 Tax=Brevibacterium TaxID=1696 RepID=A0A366IMM8_9MICO|nr:MULTISPECIES: ABC transporter permease subunit [Brevibacterium]RBP61686.1 peptide/nickel transport system permease protein [Brevibacterium sanguinis]RBP74333.1 peptide/nickel transport system permease protein [Brevibacterium celere]
MSRREPTSGTAEAPRRVALIPLLSRVISGALLLGMVGALPWLSQRDPALSVLRARYSELDPTPEAIESVRRELGLDGGPVPTSLRWWSRVLQGDLGESWVSGGAIAPGVAEVIGVSATLMAFAFAVAAIVSICLVAPVLVAVIKDRPVRGSGPVGVALTAFPEFLLASGFLVIFAVHLQWFPPYGWSGPATAVLPACALGIPAGGLFGRLLGDALAGAAQESWVRVWRLAGVKGTVLLAALFRRALAAIVDQAGLILIGLLGGAVAVEQVFAIPGLGRYLLGAANAQDLPALQAGVLVMALAAVAVGVLSGLIRLWLLGGPLPPGAITAPPERPHGDRLAQWTFTIGCGLLVVILTLGLPRDPFTIAHSRLAPPSSMLPLGADASGRDLLARIAHGAIGTLLPAVLIVLAAVAVGLLLGFLPNVIRGPIEIANATPPVIAGVVVAALVGPTVGGAAAAVLWVTWPPLAAHAISLIDEAKAVGHIRWLPLSGVGPLEAKIRYIIPMVLPALLRHSMLRLPGVALALASLGFLGLGAQPPTPEWGLLLAEGIDYVERGPWATAGPAAALVLISIIAVSAASLQGTRPPRWMRRPWSRAGSGTAESRTRVGHG